MKYALYEEIGEVLGFDSEAERDEYVSYEQLVRKDCVSVEYEQIADLIRDKTPLWDFGYAAYIFA